MSQGACALSSRAAIVSPPARPRRPPYSPRAPAPPIAPPWATLGAASQEKQRYTHSMDHLLYRSSRPGPTTVAKSRAPPRPRLTLLVTVVN
eukprot:scaffold77695_cov47-Phaeocystis_antarctica.AAC.1